MHKCLCCIHDLLFLLVKSAHGSSVGVPVVIMNDGILDYKLDTVKMVGISRSYAH